MQVNQEFKMLIERVKFKHSLSQADIAKSLGISYTYLSDVINGRVPLSEKLRLKISELYSDCIENNSEKISIKQTSTGDNSHNINGNSNVVIDANTFQQALNEISAMREALTDALKKSQEDNRRLMDLLEKLKQENTLNK